MNEVTMETAMLSTRSVVEWLDYSARKFPERMAVEDSEGKSISYREFGGLSSAVQVRLLDIGVRPGDRVGVSMRKSIDSTIAFLGILRSGGAYVPVDPFAPASRAALMLNDCEASAVFVDEDLAEFLAVELAKLRHNAVLLAVPAQPGGQDSWRIESFASEGRVQVVPRTPDDLAFMFNTSGSTGRPKAVMVTHGNVVSFVDWCSDVFFPTELDKFATHAPLHFSLSVFSLYVAWKHGATVVLIDEQTAKTPQRLASLIEKSRINIWFSTPTILSLLAQSGLLPSLDLQSLRLVLFAGETFPITHLRSLKAQLPDAQYVNVLGSTETHMMAYYPLPSGVAMQGSETIPIGKVCSHFRSKIVDDNRNDVPEGTDGELCVSGPGVTPGYWKSTEETERAFFVDEHGDRWYRTRDMVSIRPDGNLVYRGRRDRMVKKYGNRIELAEIEACLYTNSLVKEAAIVAVSGDDLGPRIHAFVVPRDGTRLTMIDLKAHCARSLSQYMVPNAFTFSDCLPRTATGKIDLRALKAEAWSPGTAFTRFPPAKISSDD